MTDRVRDSLDGLSKFLETPRDPDDILTGGSTTTADPRPLTLNEVLYRIMGARAGGLTTERIVDELAKYKTDGGKAANTIDDRITIYKTSPTESFTKDLDPIVMGSGKGLSLIQINTIRVTPAGRDTDAVAALLSLVPTIELSRCVPYLRIEVQTAVRPLSASNKVQGLSLVKFLGGAFDISSDGDNRLVMALGTGPEDDGTATKDVSTTVSGMELFTSPQTLTNPDPAIDSLRAGMAVDKFRPFMSIDRLTVDLTPQVGFFAYRSANLDLTLHDRSRLSEIASFVKPDLYGTTELYIEYGWSHPDEDSIFGKLLNSMRAREKYGVVNSSFSMSKSGEVKVKLKLFTKGMSDIQTVRIGDGLGPISSMEAVRKLQKAIGTIRAKIQGTEATNREVRGEQYLFANSDDIGTSLVLSKDSQDLVNKFITRASSNPNVDIRKLGDALGALYGTNGKGGAAQDLDKNLAKAIAENIEKLKIVNDKTDPFVFSVDSILKKIDTNLDVRSGYVSFGRLMAAFVGMPLVSQGQRKYEDVQLIFYPFNAQAGACANHNIAEFTIKISELQAGLHGFSRSVGLSLTLRDFLHYISNNFVDDIANPTFGLSKLYKSEIDVKTGQRKQPSGKKGYEDATKLNDEMQKRLLNIGTQDGVFKPPQIDVLIETVPAEAGQNQSTRTENLKTILKIHFFDRTATQHESLGALLLANREDDLRTIGNTANNVAAEHAAAFNDGRSGALKSANDKKKDPPKSERTSPDKVKSQLTKVDATVTTTPDHVYNVAFDMDRLRAFIRQNIPTLTYGTNNTGIKDASFATIQIPLLSTVHMMRSGEQGPLTPAGLTKTNLPLRTLPSRVSMTTIGCPLLQYMQQFFVDFNTNTTIDNIYGVNKLTHEIAPGRFESRIEFCPLDAYGRYESLPNQVGAMLQQLEDLDKKEKGQTKSG